MLWVTGAGACAGRMGKGSDFVKRLIAALLVPALLAVSMPTFAQAPGGAQCAAISEDVERLACYDNIFRPDTAPGALASVKLDSEQLIPARPSGRAPATMTVSCQADVLQVAFGFAGNIMSALGRDAGITLQYDLQRARSSTLPVNAENTAIVIDNTRDSLAFLDALAGASNLTVRVTPVTSRSLSVRFRIGTFEADVAPLVAACS